jgi:hypothetical protein
MIFLRGDESDTWCWVHRAPYVTVVSLTGDMHNDPHHWDAMALKKIKK